jgi:hypothetical protein
MVGDNIAQAQRGVSLADVLTSKGRLVEDSLVNEAVPALAYAGPRDGHTNGHADGHAELAAAVNVFGGPFLSPGSLTRAERVSLIDAIASLLEGIYTHLPLKRARYGADPIQRLRILRTQSGELSDDQFHYDLAEIVTGLRDAHTRYTGPVSLDGKVALLPFIVERVGPPDASQYLVTHVGAGLDPAFKPGVTIEYWNGVPIDVAVQRYSAHEVGGRPDSQRAWATQSLTFRSLRYGPPPDEHWVVVGYKTAGTGGSPGTTRETKIDWRIVDTNQVAPPSGGLPPTAQGRQALAVNPAAEAIRQAKMLLFAPYALTGEKPPAPPRRGRGQGRAAAATPILSELPKTLEAKTIAADGGPFGYLRIWAFNAAPDEFISELMRLIPLLPDRGLILDIRGNPGGYIYSSEMALQLFTPKPIQPTRFSALATTFSRAMANLEGHGGDELRPWKESLDAAVRNGELYSQALPITDPADCNVLGQRYGGPVVLVGDATSYSAADLFAAGFVDNAVGRFVCVGSATGAGGANVWNYGGLQASLRHTSLALPDLSDGIGMSFSFRRATRSGPSEGLPIEDVGVSGEPYAMTVDDLLFENRDLIAHCIGLLKAEPFTRLTATANTATRQIAIATGGIDRVDVLFDGHPGSTHLLGAATSVTVPFPQGTRVCEILGFAGDEARQRRRIKL